MKDAPCLPLLEKADLNKTAIFTGAGVDPDGLACGLAASMIVEILGGKSTIFYKGSFNRPQNKTMRQTLGLNITPITDFNDDGTWTTILSVDGPSSVCPVKPDFIIDHHEQSEPATVGNDVRQIGSASAIMWEYATKAGIDFATEEGIKLATALAIGILTDTRVGAEDSCSELDYEALAYCLKFKDNKLYRDILNYPKPAYYHDLHSSGWQNKIIERDVFVTGLGSIPIARAGVISDLAEKFAETSGCQTAIVFAVVDGKIMVSVRSSNTALNIDEFMKNAFGTGGGKRGAGGATVELPPLLQGLPNEMNDDLFKAIYGALAHKALQIAGDGVREENDKH